MNWHSLVGRMLVCPPLPWQQIQLRDGGLYVLVCCRWNSHRLLTTQLWSCVADVVALTALCYDHSAYTPEYCHNTASVIFVNENENGEK